MKHYTFYNLILDIITQPTLSNRNVYLQEYISFKLNKFMKDDI